MCPGHSSNGFWSLARIAIIVGVVGCEKPKTASPAVPATSIPVSESTFFNGATTAISHIECVTTRNGPAVVVTDGRGAYFLNPATGAEMSRVPFRVGAAVPVDVDNDGVYEFFNTARGWAEVKLYDRSGTPLWQLDGNAADWARVVKPAGGAEVRFFIATAIGLVCVDAAGSTLWTFQAGTPFWEVRILESPSPALGRLAALSDPAFAPKALCILNTDGQLLTSFPTDILSFTTVRRPDRAKESLIIACRGNELFWMTEAGSQIASCRVPIGEAGFFGLHACLLASPDGLSPRVAVRADYSSQAGKSLVCLFSAEGSLLFQRVVGSGRSIGAVSVGPGEGDDLLVGDGPGRVLRLHFGDRGATSMPMHQTGEKREKRDSHE
jgi:hypothetical protein